MSWIAVKVAEMERRTAYYGPKFFENLNSMAQIRTPPKYLMLNGWHLKNMHVAPNLEDNLLEVFGGLIIWVESKSSNRIGKNQLVGFLNGTQFPVSFDMYQCHGTYSTLFLPFLLIKVVF